MSLIVHILEMKSHWKSQMEINNSLVEIMLKDKKQLIHTFTHTLDVVNELVNLTKDSVNDLEESIEYTDAGLTILYNSYKELENARKNKKR